MSYTCQQCVQGQLTVEFIALSAAQRGPALLEGKVDLLCGADSVTLNRRESVSFSTPIFVGGIGAALRTDTASRLRTLMEGKEPEFRPNWRATMSQVLRHRTFAVVEGSKAQKRLAAVIDELDIIADTIVVPDYNQGIMLVAARKADAIFADRAILLDAAKGGPYADNIYVVGRRFTYEPIALTMRRGDDDLRLTVDRTISGLFRSGEIYDIYEEFFGDASQETQLLFRLGALDD